MDDLREGQMKLLLEKLAAKGILLDHQQGHVEFLLDSNRGEDAEKIMRQAIRDAVDDELITGDDADEYLKDFWPAADSAFQAGYAACGNDG